MDVARLAGVMRVRLPPGRDAVLMNLSPDGACVEVGSRLLPGGCVELQLSMPGWRWRGRAVVTRCRVSALVRNGGAIYEAGLELESPMDGHAAVLCVGQTQPEVRDEHKLPASITAPDDKWEHVTRCEETRAGDAKNSQ